MKCTDQTVNNQRFTQVSQLYIYVSFYLKLIRSRLIIWTGGNDYVICMPVIHYMFLSLVVWSIFMGNESLQMFWKLGLLQSHIVICRFNCIFLYFMAYSGSAYYHHYSITVIWSWLWPCYFTCMVVTEFKMVLLYLTNYKFIDLSLHGT